MLKFATGLLGFCELTFLSLLRKRRTPRITVKLEKIGLTRRLAQITRILEDSGLQMNVRLPVVKFLRMNDYGRKVFFSRNIVINRHAKEGDLLLTDADCEGSGKRISVRYDIIGKQEHAEDDWVLPIMLHPNHLREETYRIIEETRERKTRNIKILFAGNFNERNYSKPMEFNGVSFIPRHDIVKSVLESSSRLSVVQPDSFDELQAAAERGDLRQSLVIVNTERFGIPQKHLFDVLAQTEFFFAPPGNRQPFCHNIVEAMSVGAVPITQYGSWFHPPLLHGRECLAYHGERDLADLLQAVLNEEITLSGIPAMNYHDRYLSLRSAVGRVTDFIGDREKNELTLYIAGGQESDV